MKETIAFWVVVCYINMSQCLAMMINYLLWFVFILGQEKIVTAAGEIVARISAYPFGIKLRHNFCFRWKIFQSSFSIAFLNILFFLHISSHGLIPAPIMQNPNGYEFRNILIAPLDIDAVAFDHAPRPRHVPRHNKLRQTSAIWCQPVHV